MQVSAEKKTQSTTDAFRSEALIIASGGFLLGTWSNLSRVIYLQLQKLCFRLCVGAEIDRFGGAGSLLQGQGGETCQNLA